MCAIVMWIEPIYTGNGFPQMTNEYLNKILQYVTDLRTLKYKDCLVDYHTNNLNNVHEKANRAAYNIAKAELETMQAFCKSN